MQSAEFKYNKQLFTEKAKKWTQEHAVQKNKVRHFILFRSTTVVWSEHVMGWFWFHITFFASLYQLCSSLSLPQGFAVVSTLNLIYTVYAIVRFYNTILHLFTFLQPFCSLMYHKHFHLGISSFFNNFLFIPCTVFRTS